MEWKYDLEVSKAENRVKNNISLIVFASANKTNGIRQRIEICKMQLKDLDALK